MVWNYDFKNVYSIGIYIISLVLNTFSTFNDILKSYVPMDKRFY